MELIGLSANLKRPMRYLHCTVHLYYYDKYDTHKAGLSSLGGAMAPDSGKSVNPISTRGANYAHQSQWHPRFSDLPTALQSLV